MPVLIIALVVLSHLEPISNFFLVLYGWILPGRVDLNIRPFSSSAGDGIFELSRVVHNANRARSMSSLVSLHFKIVFLIVWTWRSTKPWPRG